MVDWREDDERQVPGSVLGHPETWLSFASAGVSDLVRPSTFVALDIHLRGIRGGSHTWWVTAVDAAGNRRRTDPFVLGFDLPPLAFDLLEPEDDECVGPTPELSWQAAVDEVGSGLDHYEVVVSSWIGRWVPETHGPLPAGEQRLTVEPPLPDGTHRWSVVPVDGLGNRRSSWGGRSFLVDSMPPLAPENLRPLDGEVVGFPTPEFSWSGVRDVGDGCGVSHYRLILDGEVVVDEILQLRTALPRPLEQGVYLWTVEAVDVGGNAARADEQLLLLDWTRPERFDLVEPLDGAELETARPSLSWEPASDVGSGLAHYVVSVRDDAFVLLLAEEVDPESTSLLLREDLLPGEYWWSVLAEDRAGLSRATDNWHFTLLGCELGAERACDGESEGLCDPGTGVCGADGMWGQCQGIVEPAGELCDGSDDDCDGEVDEPGDCVAGPAEGEGEGPTEGEGEGPAEGEGEGEGPGEGEGEGSGPETELLEDGSPCADFRQCRSGVCIDGACGLPPSEAGTGGSDDGGLCALSPSSNRGTRPSDLLLLGLLLALRGPRRRP